MKVRTLLLIFAAALIGIIAWNLTSSSPVSLPDGTLVRLTGMKFHNANPFYHGSTLERVLGDSIPTNGLRMGRARLQRPKNGNFYVFELPILSLEFQLSGPAVEAGQSRVVSPKFNREFRLVILGDDDFPYVEDFHRPAKFQDGTFIYVNAISYPRRSRTLRFLVQQHDGPIAPWQTVAEFRRRNRAEECEEWSAEAPPISRMSNGLEVIVGQVTVETTHSNQWQSFWATTVKIPYQVRQNGVLQTNWGFQRVRLDDASGNFLRFGGSVSMEDGWSVFTTFRSLDPRALWQIRTGVTPTSDFGTANRFTLRLPRFRTALTTNVGGRDFYVRWANDRTLMVELVDKPSDSRLALVEAWDERGLSLGNRAQSANQFEIWKSFNSMPEGPVTLDLVIAPNLPLEFTVQPRWIGPAGSSWPESTNVVRTNSP